MNVSRATQLEAPYLSKEAVDKAIELHTKGGVDLEVAVEMAILILGEERAFDIPVTERDDM